MALDGEGPGWLAGNPRVNINPASARLVDENNLLNCDLFEAGIVVAVVAVPVLTCTLICPEWPLARSDLR